MKYEERFGRYVPKDSKIETTTTDKYIEDMKCSHCGYEWSYNIKTKTRQYLVADDSKKHPLQPVPSQHSPKFPVDDSKKHPLQPVSGIR